MDLCACGHISHEGRCGRDVVVEYLNQFGRVAVLEIVGVCECTETVVELDLPASTVDTVQ